jgi:DNA-binding IscR family transcriptional regulator
MRKLTQAGLIVASLGTNANITLARSAAEISLLDVYRAISGGEREELFMIHREPNPRCPVGSKIPSLLPGVYDHIQSVMERELSQVTIAELVKRMGFDSTQAVDSES